MTSSDQPRSATDALRNLLGRFHAERIGGGGRVRHVARLDPTDITGRLTELANLERVEATTPGVEAGVTDILTATRTELARVREQRDRALALAGSLIPDQLEAERAAADLARIRRAAGL